MNDPITAIATMNTPMMVQYIIAGSALLAVGILGRKHIKKMNEQRWRPI